MSFFDINVDVTELLTDRQTDRRMNGQKKGKAGTYVAKSGGRGDVSYKV